MLPVLKISSWWNAKSIGLWNLLVYENFKDYRTMIIVQNFHLNRPASQQCIVCISLGLLTLRIPTRRLLHFKASNETHTDQCWGRNIQAISFECGWSEDEFWTNVLPNTGKKLWEHWLVEPPQTRHSNTLAISQINKGWALCWQLDCFPFFLPCLEKLKNGTIKLHTLESGAKKKKKNSEMAQCSRRWSWSPLVFGTVALI